MQFLCGQATLFTEHHLYSHRFEADTFCAFKVDLENSEIPFLLPVTAVCRQLSKTNFFNTLGVACGMA